MFRNNIKIAIRNFGKNRFYGSINLAGLTVGLSACLLIVLYLQHELGFDKFLQHPDRIYQVNLSASFGGDEFDTSNTPPPVGAALQSTFPEVESYTRYYLPGEVVMRHEDQKFTEADVWLVDSNFLEFFSFPLLEGQPANCLDGTRSMVLTAAMAKKYFGETPAVGQEIFMQNETYTVTGVLENLPPQSSLQFDALVPITASRSVERFSWSWVWLQLDTYVKLRRPLSQKELQLLEAKFPAMVRTKAAGAFERIGQNLDEYFARGNKWKLSLMPLTDVHLYSAAINSRLTTKSDIRDVYIFGTIGLFILLLACINFMNLSTARSMGRAREVGVRKVLGSRRSALVFQFLTEAFLYSATAGLAALAVVQVALPWFNRMVGLELSLAGILSGWVLAAVLAAPLVAGLLAGSYPAFYLSKFKPVAILNNGKSVGRRGNVWVRSGLVVFQFSISVVLVICTLIVMRQIHFSTNSDLGMNKENVLVIRNIQHLGEQRQAFQKELMKLPEVASASITTDLPAGGAFGDFYLPDTDGGNPDQIENLTLYSYLTDEYFIPTIGIQLIEGRNFETQRGLDSLAVIVNEATVKTIGWKEPIGKRLTYPGGRNETYEVVGVMKNLHNQSLRESIEPFALFHHSSNSYQLNHSYLAARIEPGLARQALEKAKSLWAAFAPDKPFGFSFLDENINAQYQSEERLGRVLAAFTVLSGFVACLGLLGLIGYTTEQRTKEIGIRKVLGATVTGIAGLLTKDFLRLVVIAVFLAIPLAWLLMYRWLMDFEYHVELEWWVFAGAGLAAILVALLTVGGQSVKAALMNPVESLRSE